MSGRDVGLKLLAVRTARAWVVCVGARWGFGATYSSAYAMATHGLKN